MVTVPPTPPEVGVNELIVGAAVRTVKMAVLVPVPSAFVTVIVPVVAPVGTVTVIKLTEYPKLLAAVPLNLTAVMPAKPVPVRVTVPPTTPADGEMEEMIGIVRTVKVPELVPLPVGFVTVIVPVVAPDGTTAAIDVLDKTAKAAGVPLKLTEVTPVNPVPVSVTVAPTAAEVGVNELIVGMARTVKLKGLVTVPSEFVTVSVPVVAPTGTVAKMEVSDRTV